MWFPQSILYTVVRYFFRSCHNNLTVSWSPTPIKIRPTVLTNKTLPDLILFPLSSLKSLATLHSSHTEIFSLCFFNTPCSILSRPVSFSSLLPSYHIPPLLSACWNPDSLPWHSSATPISGCYIKGSPLVLPRSPTVTHFWYSVTIFLCLPHTQNFLKDEFCVHYCVPSI